MHWRRCKHGFALMCSVLEMQVFPQAVTQVISRLRYAHSAVAAWHVPYVLAREISTLSALH
jgi:hypothetical protein